MILYLNIGLASVLAILCAWTDLKSMTIYNRHTYPAVIIGLIYSLVTAQYSHLYGSLIIFGMYLFLFIKGQGKMGGGDLKLAVALSLFLGMEPIIYGSIVAGVFLMIWGFFATWIRSGQVQTAAFVVSGKLPGGALPFGAILGPASVAMALLIAF